MNGWVANAKKKTHTRQIVLTRKSNWRGSTMMPFFSEMRMGRDGGGSGDAPSEERKAKLIGKKSNDDSRPLLLYPV